MIAVPSQNILGIGLKLTSSAMFAVMLALGKAYSVYPVAELVFFRSGFALLPLFVWLLLRGDFPRALYTRRIGGHLLRSLAGTASMSCMFAAYGLLPLADATAIGYAAPLLIVVLAGIVLDERISVFRWGAVAIGFCGVLVILSEHIGATGGPERSAAGALFALGSAGLVAVAMVQTRRLTQSEDTGAITFWFQVTATCAGAAMLAVAGLWHPDWPGGALARSQTWLWPQPAHWLPLVLIGFFGGVGQIFMTQGYRFADVSVLAVFDYSSLLFAIAIGLAVFGEAPSRHMLVGAAIVVTAGLAVLWRERRIDARSQRFVNVNKS